MDTNILLFREKHVDFDNFKPTISCRPGVPSSDHAALLLHDKRLKRVVGLIWLQYIDVISRITDGTVALEEPVTHG